MTTYTAPHPAAHTEPEHHMPPVRAFSNLVALQARRAWREPAGLLLGLGMPIFLLVAFGIVPAFKQPHFGDARFSTFGYYVPALICLSITMIALYCLPPPFVSDRDNHWLRRISTTPVPPAWLLGAQTAVSAVLAVLAVAVLTLGSVAFFGVAAPAQPAGFLLAVLLLITAMFAVGLLLIAVARTSSAAEGLAMALWLPLLFFSGFFVPLEVMPTAVRTISDYTPLGAASAAMRDAMLGTFPTTTSLLVLAAWTVVCGLAAVRFYRWE